ncbi:MAG TPA: HigA family addiction module antitoxin [Polyangiaceae bacterium]
MTAPNLPISPGAFLHQKLEAAGWSQKDLAWILGRPEQVISEIVRDKKRITTETAIALAQAFGNTADEWLSIRDAHALLLAERRVTSGTVAARAYRIAEVEARIRARREAPAKTPSGWRKREKVRVPFCDLCSRKAVWEHATGGLRCARCPRPEVGGP